MAYHIIIPDDSSPNNLLLDIYLGSAATMEMYWESVGYKLRLPIISALTERADSEEGLTLSGHDLVQFKDEIKILERYYLDNFSEADLPNGLLSNIEAIIEKTEDAINRGLTLMIA